MAMICVNGARSCDGCMACQPEPEPVYCPVCGEEVTDYLYKDKDGDVVGCEYCIFPVDPYDE